MGMEKLTVTNDAEAAVRDVVVDDELLIFIAPVEASYSDQILVFELRSCPDMALKVLEPLHPTLPDPPHGICSAVLKHCFVHDAPPARPQYVC